MFAAFYRARKFSAEFTKSRHWARSRAKWIQSTLSNSSLSLLWPSDSNLPLPWVAGRVRVMAPLAGNITVIRCKYIGGLVPPNPANVHYRLIKIFPGIKLHKDDSYLETVISLTRGAEPFLRSRQLCSYSRTSQHFMEPEASLPCSKESSTGLYPEPDRSNPYHPILSL
jgi:hypothetical protein